MGTSCVPGFKETKTNIVFGRCSIWLQAQMYKPLNNRMGIIIEAGMGNLKNTEEEV